MATTLTPIPLSVLPDGLATCELGCGLDAQAVVAGVVGGVDVGDEAAEFGIAELGEPLALGEKGGDLDGVELVEREVGVVPAVGLAEGDGGGGVQVLEYEVL